ncbi:sulfatase-like hydrolase/transferase [Paracoccus seriniphilus]|uniref:Arylsulfatase A n=1 Tax=Paracoccus seriniphilus TaxID=184748 RepID=A0A239Q1L4_9RHOB|nr:sulfatase-like hydrolase/transferase [Paracoccus seriniphilus]WCR16306.1 sulfatase-like hydrolase/transferase [Paracoccus seriniphilus]SNT75847.1 Arylsulfatase A [Paracoccus seriniphilus]
MKESASRPNILFITADQQRSDCYGFRGRNVQTPHLDMLAREGTSLETVITPCVVCQPARASILTGLLPRTHGVHDNGIDLDPEIGEKGFAGSLSAAGYHTAKIGKAHFSTYHVFEETGRPESIPGSAEVPADWRGPYMGFDHAELVLVGHNWWLPEQPPRGLAYEEWYYSDGRGEEKNKLLWESSRDHKGAPQVWSSKLPVAWHNSTWIADRAIDYLRRDHTQPFCLWVSFPDPHHPFDAPEPWASLHRPEEVDLPRHRRRDFTGRPWWHKAAVETEIPSEHKEIREKYSRMPEVSDEHLREIIANTYGQIALIDHSVGRILIELERQGLADNTYIVYTADHGDWLGDHGLVLKGPMPFEGLLNVGAIVKGPDIPAGKTCHEPLSTLDLGATFMDWAGAESLMPIHGRSMRDVLSGDGTREAALSEWELLPGRVGVGLSLRTVRSKTAKLTMDLKSGAGEMYDLARDPDELTNLFDDPAHAELRQQLTEILMSRPDDMRPNQVQVGMA